MAPQPSSPSKNPQQNRVLKEAHASIVLPVFIMAVTCLIERGADRQASAVVHQTRCGKMAAGR
jgi:hypothetical protein